MKKILIISLLFFSAWQADAQSHRAGNLFATVGVGAGNYGYHLGPSRSGFGLPLTFNFDYGIHDYVSLGAYGGFLFRDNSVATGFGGRGSFHFWQLINDKVAGDLKGDIFDIYVSVYSGGEVSSFYTNRFRAGGILGGRWFFNPNIALTAEFGGPMAYFMAGVSFKLLD